MLTVDFNNLFQTAEKFPEYSLNGAELDSKNEEFAKYKDLVRSREQGFLDLYDQPENVEKIIRYTEENQDKFNYIVILGIGGSMLGPQTILSALDTPLSRELRGFKKDIKVLTVDNSDPFLVKDIESQIDVNKTLFLVQTKSGGTPETLSQYFYFRDLVEKSNLEVKNHFAFVTDPENGYLRKVANEENIPAFPIPANVGGRFSVLSSVGLLVSALVGLDIEKMLLGAKESKETFFANNKAAYQFALSQYLLNKKGKNITVLMPYVSRLKKFADWYIQLLSESIGKEKDLKDNTVNIGITPVPSLGATDQHSQAQLFKEGPFDKLIVFIKLEESELQVKIPEVYKDEAKFKYLKNHTFNDLIDAELAGTRQSFSESGKASLTINIEKLDEFYLGALFMFFEISVAFLGEMFEINTFDQPGVERSKLITQEILEG
jgi:glucose-6-phosphate isomerase